jgi:hypothetical protein
MDGSQRLVHAKRGPAEQPNLLPGNDGNGTAGEAVKIPVRRLVALETGVLASQDFGDAAPHGAVQAHLFGATKNSLQRRWIGVEISDARKVS